jgi:Mg-chelatase subunit ChlD
VFVKISFFLLIPFLSVGQLLFNEKEINLGTIPKAYLIEGNIVITNSSPKIVHLLRADAEPGIKVFTSKKSLSPGDSCLLLITFYPEKKGKFLKEIRLISSDSKDPHLIYLSGIIRQVEADDKTACYYFGKKIRERDNRPIPVVINDQPVKRDASNRIPEQDPREEKPQNNPLSPLKNPVEKVPVPINRNDIIPDHNVPNNILFLIDVSGSMKDSLKLPVMKIALHKLIDGLRDIDSVTFITYSDTVKIIKEATTGSDKPELHHVIKELKARGLTRGRKAIHLSQQIAQKHYIAGGNNQILIISDGIFRFDDNDYKKWKKNEGDKKITVSTIACGNDKDAIRNLKEIARTGSGSYIHLKGKGSESLILEEIKDKSRK